jgi:hypothetical protein
MTPVKTFRRGMRRKGDRNSQEKRDASHIGLPD